ncbi:MAG TPA: hypothetical protein VMT34_14320, partial [Aggregatilineales bacterium]|nr:hypothetical protein [Aggregatilineales bacterium]
QIRAALTPRFAAWQDQKDGLVHHVPYGDAGFKAADNTKEVVYGHCASGQFYTFVLESSVPEIAGADAEGYSYTPGTTPDHCLPDGWNVITDEKTDIDWYFVTLNTARATVTAAVNAGR